MWSYLEEISIWFLNKKRESSHSNFNRSFPTSLILFKLNQNFPTSSVTFQLQSELSKFSPNFQPSDRTFLLHSFQLHVGLSKLKLSNFSFFPTALSYTYPYDIRPKSSLQSRLGLFSHSIKVTKSHLISPVSYVPVYVKFDLAKVNYIIEVTVYSPCVLLEFL